MKRILGIDWGKAHIGLAVGSGFLVEPLEAIDVESNEKSVRSLQRIVDELDVEAVVLGITHGSLRQEIIKFKSLLEQELSVPVRLCEEEFSSFEARQRALEAGKKLKNLGKKEHSLAACVLLERFHEENEL